MSRPSKEIFEHLGPRGLSRVLDDLLDQNRLVRLANTCGLEYPGMRTRSQKRQRIISDLVKRTSQLQATRTAVYRVLKKETRATANKWQGLSAAERSLALSGDTAALADADFSRRLFVLACVENDPGPSIEKLLARRPSNGGKPVADSGGGGGPTREVTRLTKLANQLERKVNHLEAQLATSREAQKNSKRELVQRNADITEGRVLAERLRQDLKEARSAAGSASRSAAGDGIEPALKLLRKLGTEQKKVTRQLSKLEDRAGRTRPGTESPTQLVETVDGLRRELTALRREHKKEREQNSQLVDELRSEIAAQRKAAARSSRRRRTKGEEARVAVFIDVQNVYYGARRLKGKLDFDAMLQAAVLDRRLIQATAYVVESKEIDQSGFIALLEHRAIEVRRKTLSVRVDGSKKGDWDMELALDILDAAAHLDVVVLVSGDGDFTSLVKRVKRTGPRVEVMGFPRNTAKSLLEAADSFQPLDRRFMIYPSRRKRSPIDHKAKSEPGPTSQ